MAKINQYQCDICQKEHREEKRWHVELQQWGAPIKDDLDLYDVCNSCACKIKACITGSEPE